MPVSSIDERGMGLTGHKHDRRSGATMEEHRTYQDQIEEERAYNEGARQIKDDRRRKALWKESQVPARHRAKTGEFGEPLEWALLRGRMQGRIGTGFLVGFLGSRGPGKTQLAVDLIQSGCDCLLKCRYAKAMDFFLDVRATYGDKDQSERQVIDQYVKYDLLVLDEIGVQAESPFEGRLLAHLIDKRYDAMKDTILISNLLPKEFKKTVGKSIHDRLAETGTIEEFNWASHRPATAEGVKGC